MKLKLGRLFALSAVSMASNALLAQSNVVIYGIIDGAVTTASSGLGTSSIGRVDSGIGPGSRWGFRGTEDLGNGLKANFVLESGMAMDTGALIPGGLAFGRQAWVGLSGSGVSVSVGRQYSPMDDAIAFSSVNYFYYWGSPASIGFGADAAPKSTPTSGGFQSTDRINNSIAAKGVFGKLTVSAITAFNDEATNKTGRFLGVGGTYADGPLRVDVAANSWKQYASEITAGAAPSSENNFFAGGSYNFGPLKANAGYYKFNPSTANKTLTAASNLGTKAAWVGARMPFGPHAISAQVIQATYSRIAGVSNGRATTLGLAYEYTLSKRSKLYVSAGNVNNNATSAQSLVAGAAAVAAAGNGAKIRAASLGMTHFF